MIENSEVDRIVEEFGKEFVQDNGVNIEPSIKDPIGSAGPITRWLRTTLTNLATTEYERGKADSKAYWIEQNRIDVEEAVADALKPFRGTRNPGEWEDSVLHSGVKHERDRIWHEHLGLVKPIRDVLPPNTK
jgi:hypothetical protein